MGTVAGPWRFKMMIILLVFSTAVYSISGLFSNIAEEGNIENGYITYTNNDEDLSYNQTDFGTSKGQSFLDVLGGIGNFLTFGSIDNGYIRAFFNFIMSLVWITIGYISYTFIKEWIPLT